MGSTFCHQKVAKKNAEAKRLIKQGAIEIDGKKITKLEQKLAIKKGSVIKVGRRKFVRII